MHFAADAAFDRPLRDLADDSLRTLGAASRSFRPGELLGIDRWSSCMR